MGLSLTSLVKRSCLRKDWGLRTQMIVSFVSLAVVSLVLILVVSVSVAVSLGTMAEEKSTTAIDVQIKHNLKKSSLETARVIEKKFTNLESQNRLMTEAFLDRWQQGFEDVRNSSIKMYPLPDQPTYLDTSKDTSAGAKATEENMRQSGYWDKGQLGGYVESGGKMSLKHSVFFFQGSCDPASAQPSRSQIVSGYYPGCGASNNQVPAGSRLEKLRDASSILDYFFPNIYKAFPDISSLGFWGYNEGKGALRYYPGLFPIPFDDYQPEPCIWGKCKNLPNRNPNCFEDPSTTCILNKRDYSPVERPWYQQAIKSKWMNETTGQGRLVHDGPYRSAWTPETSNQWLMSIAQAVYEPQVPLGQSAWSEKNLLGVMAIDLDISQIADTILGIKFYGSASAALVANDGTVLISKEWDPNLPSSVSKKKIWAAELKWGLSKSAFEQIKASEEQQSSLQIQREGQTHFLATARIPTDPAVYLSSSTPPPNRYMILISVPVSEAHKPIQEMAKNVQSTTGLVAGVTAAIVGGFTLLITLIVAHVSIHLTRPLSWMNRCADQITNNATKSSLVEGMDGTKADKDAYEDDNEIGQLVHQFKKMIAGLGGPAAAKTLARTVHYPKNPYNKQPGQSLTVEEVCSINPRKFMGE